MSNHVTIIGNYASPYVRKVLVCLESKRVPYEIDPIVPFYGNEEFARLSPLRRIPVLIDGSLEVSDSTVICEYLDEKYPSPPLLPALPELRARARWFEEFADSRMGDVFIWRLFNQVVIRRAVWGEKTDEAVLKKTLEVDIPNVLDYLERNCPTAEFLFGSVSIADIAIATFFRNATFSKWSIDAARWPIVAAYVDRVLNLDAFVKLRPYEEICTRIPVPQQRAALLEAGAPVAAKTFGTDKPVRGVMTT